MIGDGQLDLAEFRVFMDSGVIGLFKAAGLWDAMTFANLFDVGKVFPFKSQRFTSCSKLMAPRVAQLYF